MRIVSARLHHILLPLREPFVISYASWTAMPSIILEMETDDGRTGWGEAVPDEIVTGETAAAAMQVLQHLLLPLIIGRDPHDLEDLHHVMASRLGGNTSAKAAIDIACHDLIAQAASVPVYDLVGGRAHEVLTYPRVISIGAPDEMAAQAERAVDAGYASIKIKVGAGDRERDVARIRAVCEAVEHRVPVRVDVNQGWGAAGTAIGAVTQLGGLGICWIEEPIAMGDLRGLAEVRAHSAVPIMADESCQGMASLLEIVRLRAADLINLKLMKTAGLYRALQMASVAQAAGLDAQVGSMVESSVASSAGYHLAMARRSIRSQELTGPLLFTTDVGDLHYELPQVHLSGQPGLGLRIDRDALASLTTGAVEVVG